MSSTDSDRRVVSGMRPTGRMHIGHYHGAIKNWVQLQHQYECFYFVADWHALTTHYQDPQVIEQHTLEMVVDWLAAGLSPAASTIFVQSRVPEHAELHVLLSMITPVGWLERMPTYKELQQKLTDRDLATYGFLGYPVLQAADVLMYRVGHVPVGADQVAHIEVIREIARRFNHIYGREPDFEEKALAAARKMGRKAGRFYQAARRDYLERGDREALEGARALLVEQQNLSVGDRERLFGYLEGSGRQLLPEPQALLTDTPVLPGLDGDKMSKSYDNVIRMREDPKAVERKVRTMQTDPARVRRADPGNPDNCPVFDLHKALSSEEVCGWAAANCRSAGIGCIDCKAPLIDTIVAEQAPFHERATEFEDNPDLVRRIIIEGSEAAQEVARATMQDVRAAVGVGY